MQELTLSVRDTWMTPRLGASMKKMSVAFRAVLFGYLAYAVFGHLSYLVTGIPVAETWALYRFFPPPPDSGSGIMAMLVWDMGAVTAVLTLMIGGTGIAKITYRQLKGDNFYGNSDAWRYALARGRSTLGTPFINVVLLALICLALWIIGWISSIPFAGPLFLGLMALPAFGLALLAVYTAVAFLFSLLYTPSVIGATGEDALEGVIQVFSLLWNNPWRTAAFTFTVVLTTLMAAYLLAILTLLALTVLGGVLGTVMGPSFDAMAAGTISYLPLNSLFFIDPPTWIWPGPLMNLIPAVDITSPPLTGSQGVAVFIGGLSLVVASGVLLSYIISSLTSGFTVSYIVLRRIKDGEDILEWSDEVDETEYREAED
ncbi:hypothetical protein ACFL6T_01320 [Candidatus Zixiibacteriota bacterium]